MKRIILSLVVLTVSVANVFAGSVDALPFLRMGVSARAMGMGSAFTGIASDTSASYYNPAGLAQLQTRELGLMTTSLSNDRSFNWAAFGLPLGSGGLAVAVLMSGVDDIPKADLAGLTGSKFKSSDSALYLTYSGPITELIDVGLSAKGLRSTLDEKSASGFGFDLGTKFNPTKKLSCGVVLQDLVTSRKWDTANDTREDIPAVFRGGVAYKLLKDKLVVAGDLSKISDRQTIKYNLGTEYSLASLIKFRAGLDDGNITAGFGLSLSFLSFDYALRFDDLDDNSNRHYLSLGITF